MNSKMREALTEAITEILRIDSKKRSQGSWATERDVPYIIDQIISRYGDLEFTRDEVRGMLATFGRETHDSLGNKGCSSAYITQEANKILARHTEGEKSLREYVSDTAEEAQAMPEWKRKSLGPVSDNTPTIKASEIEKIAGVRITEESQWIAKDLMHSGVRCVVFNEKPQISKLSALPEGHWSSSYGHVDKFYHVGDELISGPWQDSLRRIIHDDEEHTLDREVGEIQGELILLTRRVAAIEQWILAKGGEDIGSE